MEVARQLENEEAVLSHSRDDREGSRESDRDDDRERIRKGGSFERERKESNRYSPYPTSKSDRERAKKSSSRKENRVYVSNLPFSIKWQDLKDHMKKGIYDSSVSCFCLVYCPVAWVNYRLSLSYVRLLLSSFLLKEKSWLCCVVGDVVFAEILEDSSGKCHGVAITSGCVGRYYYRQGCKPFFIVQLTQAGSIVDISDIYI